MAYIWLIEEKPKKNTKKKFSHCGEICIQIFLVYTRVGRKMAKVFYFLSFKLYFVILCCKFWCMFGVNMYIYCVHILIYVYTLCFSGSRFFVFNCFWRCIIVYTRVVILAICPIFSRLNIVSKPKRKTLVYDNSIWFSVWFTEIYHLCHYKYNITLISIIYLYRNNFPSIN